MTNQEILDLQEKLDSIAKDAEDVAALAWKTNPDTSKKFLKIAKYVRNISTCVRLYGAIPAEPQAPPVNRLVSNLIKLTTLVPDTVETARRVVR